MQELETLVRQDYEANGRRSAFRITPIFRHLRSHFGEWPLEDFRLKVETYQRVRREEGASNATIRNELTMMGHGFRLAARREQLRDVPFIPKPSVRNAREGFVTDDTFTAIRLRLPDPIDSLALFAYVTGWRRAEVTRLRWCEVDLEGGTVRLPAARSKNGHGRTFPFGSHHDLSRLMARLWANRKGEFVFHRHGKPITDFRVVWKNACEGAGVPDLVFHDLRRSAARNMRRKGLAENTCMLLLGHSTPSIFRRYDIVDEADLAEAVARLGGKAVHAV